MYRAWVQLKCPNTKNAVKTIFTLKFYLVHSQLRLLLNSAAAYTLVPDLQYIRTCFIARPRVIITFDDDIIHLNLSHYDKQ